MLPEDLLLRKVLFLKVCELLENTFPNLREGDTPQRKARVSKLHCKTSRNQIPDVDLGAVLPRRASGCVGCRRRENILIRITGLLSSKFRAVIQPAWKALKSNRHKAISRNRLKKVFEKVFGGKAEP